MSLCHDTLEGMIKSNFNLMYFHKVPLDTVEDMIPWERQIYLTLIIQEMERQKLEQEKLMQQQKRGAM